MSLRKEEQAAKKSHRSNRSNIPTNDVKAMPQNGAGKVKW